MKFNKVQFQKNVLCLAGYYFWKEYWYKQNKTAISAFSSFHAASPLYILQQNQLLFLEVR